VGEQDYRAGGQEKVEATEARTGFDRRLTDSIGELLFLPTSAFRWCDERLS